MCKILSMVSLVNTVSKNCDQASEPLLTEHEDSLAYAELMHG